jgi:hypothetical protein
MTTIGAFFLGLLSGASLASVGYIVFMLYIANRTPKAER